MNEQLASSAREKKGSTQPRRVLIIEDHPDTRNSLHRLLSLWGHNVEVANNGVEGLQKSLEWMPDIALVDIGLPLLDGYELAKQIRKHLGERRILVALTAYSSLDDRQTALRAGFDEHMGKPADLRRLQRLLA